MKCLPFRVFFLLMTIKLPFVILLSEFRTFFLCVNWFISNFLKKPLKAQLNSIDRIETFNFL